MKRAPLLTTWVKKLLPINITSKALHIEKEKGRPKF
jgi:hypothetical protein